MVFHVPILAKECIELLIQNKKGVYCDATLGDGGHALQILKKILPGGMLLAIDQDEQSINVASQRIAKQFNNLVIKKDNFINLRTILQSLNLSKLDGILFDTGYSRRQMMDGNRGFSYRLNGPLDMRINCEQKITAKDILNTYNQKELEWIFTQYGEINYGRSLAQAIIAKRLQKPIEYTFDLLAIVKETIPVYLFKKKHPGRQVFQALRIAVNNELEALKIGLVQSVESLKVRGRLIVISYHSLEDKIVKELSQQFRSIKTITKKPITPSFKEMQSNYSAKSAKMRVFEKVDE